MSPRDPDPLLEEADRLIAQAQRHAAWGRTIAWVAIAALLTLIALVWPR